MSQQERMMKRLFGSQRALKTVEDFTEFEQRAACFDLTAQEKKDLVAFLLCL